MGLISVPGITDGTSIEAGDVNTPVNTIVNEINGNLNYLNLADNAVTTEKITDSSVTTVKIADSSVTTAKLDPTLTDRSLATKVLSLRIDNGTGTRTTVSSASFVALTCTGTTSYTAPTNTAVDIQFTMQIMAQSTTGVLRAALSINGTVQNEATYIQPANWTVQTISYKVQVAAGATITIGVSAKQESGGSSVLTNANTDTTFPNSVTGVVLPRYP